MSIETINAIINPVLEVMIIAVVGALAVASYRLLTGPTYADRFIAVDMLTGLAIAACALTAIATGRNEYLDVAFGFALIAFVATAAFAAFLEKKVHIISRRVRADASHRDNDADGADS